MITAIDAHHHFWDTAKGDYSWMTPAHTPINRAFGPNDLAPLLEPAGVDGTVLVQTWSSIDETFDFLKIADGTEFVKGVVGWVDMTSRDVCADLDSLLDHDKGHWLKGIRHQVHDEEDPDWLVRPDVQQALKLLESHGLVYDLLIRPREIPAAIRTIESIPELRFVIDHIAKPDIENDKFDDWAGQMEAFRAHRDHVWCKLSGMVTEANWSNWQSADYGRYIDHVIHVFGVERAMLGSDWPVCTLATDYRSTLGIVRRAIGNLRHVNQVKLLRTNAIEAYNLPVAA